MQNLTLKLALNFICKKNSKKLSFSSLASILGITFGVAAFLVVITILNSFQTETKQIISTINPNLIIFSSRGIPQPEAFSQHLKTLITEPIRNMQPFVYNESILSLGAHSAATYIRALHGTHSASADALSRYIYPQGALKTLDVSSSLIHNKKTISIGKIENLPHVILGAKLAENLGAKFGDVISLMSMAPGGATYYNKLYVTGVLNIGFSQYDGKYALMNFEDGVKLFGNPNWASAIEIRLENPDTALALSRKLNEQLSYTAVAWQEIDSDLFEQINRDGIAIKLIVLIISFVAGFNIIVTLGLTVVDRERQIALLRSLGAKKSDIIGVFVWAGAILGTLGALLGAVVGLVILKIFSTIKLGDLQEFYYFEKIPVNIDAQLVVLAFCTAIALAFLGALYPAWKATKVSPLLGLKHGL